jgi:hypothetical protein
LNIEREPLRPRNSDSSNRWLSDRHLAGHGLIRVAILVYAQIWPFVAAVPSDPSHRISSIRLQNCVAGLLLRQTGTDRPNFQGRRLLGIHGLGKCHHFASRFRLRRHFQAPPLHITYLSHFCLAPGSCNVCFQL